MLAIPPLPSVEEMEQVHIDVYAQKVIHDEQTQDKQKETANK